MRARRPAGFIPPESGLEGDAIDRRIQFSGGDVKTAQVKLDLRPAASPQRWVRVRDREQFDCTVLVALVPHTHTHTFRMADGR